MTEQFSRKESQLSHEDLAQQELDAFVNNPGLTEMATLFGVEELPENQADRLLMLQKIAIEHWDFRKGAERQATNWDNELLDQEGSEQWNTIFGAANKLGLVQNSEPTNKNPNYLVVLGGANRAPFDRLRYGLERVEGFDHVAYLGSTRPVSDAEREKAADYAPDALTEFELGCGAFETLLGAKMVDEVSEERNGDTWGMRFYEFEHNGETKSGFVLSTPQQIGERRATTYDNYKFFADRAELAENPSHTVASVTTGFYTAGQHLPGVQELTLKYGTTVETIGHSAEYSGVKRKPSQLLQETKAAIDAAVRLQEAITIRERHTSTTASEVTQSSEPGLNQLIEEALLQPVPTMGGLRERKKGYDELPIETSHPKFNESLVDIADYGLAGQSYYSRPNAATGEAIPGVPKNMYLRKSVAETLANINAALQNPVFTEFFGGEVELYVEDALRPVSLQTRLHDELIPALLRDNHPNITDEEVEERVKDLIAIPSSNPQKPSPHATGGALDIILRYKQNTGYYVEGSQVPMGHSDADTSDRILPDYFELNEPLTDEDRQAQRNRRAYYAVMTGKAFGVDTGLVCNPTEWWHWGSGDQLAAKVRGDQAAYYSLAELEE